MFESERNHLSLKPGKYSVQKAFKFLPQNGIFAASVMQKFEASL